MHFNPNHKPLQGRPFIALLLVILICALLSPLIGNAESAGGDLPNPIPPLPNGEGQTIIDSTYFPPSSEDSTLN